MPFNLEALQVVEIQRDIRSKCGKTLKALRSLTDAFCPESCARYVMIFFNISSRDKFDSHFKAVAALSHKCNHLKGQAAYAFLLSWIIGGEHRITKKGSKLPLYNDNHILGKFTALWTAFVKENLEKKPDPDEGKTEAGSEAKETKSEPGTKEAEKEAETKEIKVESSTSAKTATRLHFIQIINALLTDAHEIRQRIEKKCYGKDAELRANLDTVIINVVYSRSQGMPVLHDAMADPHYHSQLLEFMKKQLARLKLQISKLKEGSLAKAGVFSRLDVITRQIMMLQETQTAAIVAKDHSGTKAPGICPLSFP